MNHVQSFLILLGRAIIFGLVLYGAYALAHQHWKDLFIIVQALLLSSGPVILNRYCGIDTPKHFRASLIIFIFTTLILGELQSFYDTIWWWDLALHGAAGFGIALIGYMILGLIFRRQMPVIRAAFLSAFAVTFSLGISVIWEIYEFTIDQFFNTNMQPSGDDTMWDLIIAFACALAAGAIGWRWIRYDNRGTTLEEIATENGIAETPAMY